MDAAMLRMFSRCWCQITELPTNRQMLRDSQFHEYKGDLQKDAPYYKELE